MMRVLVTGSAGFVGRNLVQSLCNIRDGKDMRPQYAGFLPLVVDTFDVDDAPEALAERAATADAVVHLAGVNRPEDPAGFVRGNRDLTQVLVDALETSGNQCPVVLASSVQATLEGRYAGSDYGRSKREAENVLHEHSRRTGAEALIYRLPNVYGKWCRPNYNSVVATFCYNTARGLPLRVDDPSTSLELIYIDDLVSCILDALLGKARRTEDGFCQAGPTDHVTLGQIVDLLRSFSETQGTCALMDVTPGTFATKLLSTYMSYLPPVDATHALRVNSDERGSFVELLRAPGFGQVSVNVVKPGKTKGQHWHHSKWEKFCVVAGEGVIAQRPVSPREGEPAETTIVNVRSSEPTMVDILPGYTHRITNTSATDDLVVVMWANEQFDPGCPDTYRLEV